MADGNGANDWRDDLDRRVGALEKARREMEDTLVLLVEIETRMSHLLREQAEAIATHAPRLNRAELLLTEMADKVNFLIDREMHREGGPETQR